MLADLDALQAQTLQGPGYIGIVVGFMVLGKCIFRLLLYFFIYCPMIGSLGPENGHYLGRSTRDNRVS